MSFSKHWKISMLSPASPHGEPGPLPAFRIKSLPGRKISVLGRAASPKPPPNSQYPTCGAFGERPYLTDQNSMSDKLHVVGRRVRIPTPACGHPSGGEAPGTALVLFPPRRGARCARWVPRCTNQITVQQRRGSIHSARITFVLLVPQQGGQICRLLYCRIISAHWISMR
jgi:hypothetical protein